MFNPSCSRICNCFLSQFIHLLPDIGPAHVRYQVLTVSECLTGKVILFYLCCCSGSL